MPRRNLQHLVFYAPAGRALNGALHTSRIMRLDAASTETLFENFDLFTRYMRGAIPLGTPGLYRCDCAQFYDDNDWEPVNPFNNAVTRNRTLRRNGQVVFNIQEARMAPDQDQMIFTRHVIRRESVYPGHQTLVHYFRQPM